MAAGNRLRVDPVDLRCRIDEPLGQREADPEIFEIGGRRHHHGIGEPLNLDRDRHFDRDHALDVGIARHPQTHPAHRARKEGRGIGHQ